jgi:hypothetical protein
MSRVEGEQLEQLSRMRRRLDEFRRSSSPGKPLPGWAWAAAARLARRYGVHRTGRALGLEYNKLKRMSGGTTTATGGGTSRAGRAAAIGAVKFVELPGPLPLGGAPCRLRLSAPTGHHLELEMAAGAATDVLLGLCRAGWGGGR